jgi:uncharacterized repeat protein (TIGR01451 family)
LSEMTLVADVSVYPAESDPDLSNNTATSISEVRKPSITIIAGSASLSTESIRVNGVVDRGETVTAQLELKSVGTITATNVTATVLTNDWVVKVINGTNDYGTMASGASVSRSFTFTASTNLTTNVVVWVRVQAGTNETIITNFSLPTPNTVVCSNESEITIPDSGLASPYPSSVQVSGAVGTLSKLTVTLFGLTHSFVNDVNVLLVAPNMQGVVLMAHAGNQSSLTNATLTFDDDVSARVPADGVINSGTYQPSAYEDIPDFSPAPAGPYGTNLISFAGIDPNGAWSLYVLDSQDGDSGVIAKGWKLQATTIVPSSRMADLAVTGSVSSSQGVIGSLVSVVYTVTNGGPETAASVGFTNVLSDGLDFVSAAPIGVLNGKVYTAEFGPLVSGSSVRVTNVAKVLATNLLTFSASVGAGELDLNPSNNVITLATVGKPLTADLVASLAGSTNLVAGSDASYVATIVNRGPSDAAHVVITSQLPASAIVKEFPANVSSYSTNYVVIDGTQWLALSMQIDSLAANASVSVAFTVGMPTPGLATNIVSVVSSAEEPLPADNRVALVTVVAPTGPSIIAGDINLVTSGVRASPIESGQTVTVSLSLANVGTAPASNVTAVLLPSSVGVTDVSGSTPTVGSANSYGTIAVHSSVSAQYAFKVTASGGSVVTLNLQVMSGTLPLGQVSYSFVVSGLYDFSNSGVITIPDSGSASPYPSTINVSGLGGMVRNVSVTLSNLTHSYPGDLKIALVSPAGQTVVLTTNLCGPYGVSNVTLTFSGASTTPFSEKEAATNGVYEVCGCGQDLAIGGFPTPSQNNGMEAFAGSEPNGIWSLYVYDAKRGDQGKIAGGWILHLDVFENVTSSADLVLSAHAAYPILSGTSVPVIIVVTNKGPDVAENVTVISAMPSTLSSVSASASQGVLITNQTGKMRFNLGTISVGGSASVTNVVQCIDGFVGYTAIIVNVSSDAEDPNLSDNSIGNVQVDVRKPVQLGPDIQGGRDSTDADRDLERRLHATVFDRHGDLDRCFGNISHWRFGWGDS